jgi:hypothetical protein
LLRNIFRKNAENAAPKDSRGVELGRCKTLNGFSQLRELCFPTYATPLGLPMSSSIATALI